MGHHLTNGLGQYKEKENSDGHKEVVDINDNINIFFLLKHHMIAFINTVHSNDGLSSNKSMLLRCSHCFIDLCQIHAHINIKLIVKNVFCGINEQNVG